MRTIKSISIKKFIEISDLIKDETSIHDRMNVFQIVTGCDIEEIRIIPAEILDTMWNEFVHNCFDLGDGSVDNIITIDGKSYGLINVKGLTVGEMADIDVLKNHPVLNFNLHKIMAILYRPLISKLPFKIEPYSSETFEERAELFAEKMPVKVALNTAVFFLNILGSLNAVIKDFLDPKIPKATKKKKILNVLMSVALEVGIRLFTSLRKTTSLKSKKSQK
jgi:hypothetical protein